MNIVFAKALYELKRGNDTMLVTIVSDSGSAPRGAGSIMVVGREGRLAGTIGGGSVEFQSEKRALDLLARGECELHEFKLHANEAEDIGMICGGDVDVWFQHVPAESIVWREALQEALECTKAKRGGWLVQRLDGSDPTLVSHAGFEVVGEPVNPQIDLLAGACRCKGGQFALPLPAKERALIFGGGHIARALVPLLASVGFRPMVIDDREAFSRPESFPDADSVLNCEYPMVDKYIDLRPDDYSVVITHGHAHDFDVLLQLLQNDYMPAYVGVIGSKTKSAAVRERLHGAGIPQWKTALVHGPIGTAIKATTPEEIAVSIVGEMILVRAERRERAAEPHEQFIVAPSQQDADMLKRHREPTCLEERSSDRELVIA